MVKTKQILRKYDFLIVELKSKKNLMLCSAEK